MKWKGSLDLTSKNSVSLDSTKFYQRTSDPTQETGKTIVYSKTDGKVYKRTPDGTVSEIGGGGGLAWSRITANTTASSGNGYLISASANLTLTLPASPSEGDIVGVVDADGMATTYTITVARNGSNIRGQAKDLIIDTDRSGFTLVYVDATQGWVIVTEIAGGGGDGLAWTRITSNINASPGNGYLLSASGNLTVTLPASPSEGDAVGVVDADGKATSYTLTVARNGSNIMGQAQDLTIDVDRSGFTLVYSDATQGWVIVTEIGGGTSNNYHGWVSEVDVTTDQTVAITSLGKCYRFTRSTTADRSLTLPAVSASDDGKILWVHNESSHIVTVKPGSGARIWESGSGYGIELVEPSIVCLRYDHSRTTWDIINKSGGLVRQEGLKLLTGYDLSIYQASSTPAVSVNIAKSSAGYAYNKLTIQLDPTKLRFSPSCYYMPTGNNTYAFWYDSSDWDVFGSSSGADTVALWFRAFRTSVSEILYVHYQDSSNYWIFYKQSGNTLNLDLKSGGSYQFQINGGSISANTWYHAAFVRKGSAVGVYLNGQQVAYQSLSSTYNFSGRLYAFQNGNNNLYFEGYAQDLIVIHANPYDANPNSGNTDTLSNWNRQFPGVM